MATGERGEILLQLESPLERQNRKISAEYGFLKKRDMPMDYSARLVRRMLTRLELTIEDCHPIFRRILFSRASLQKDDLPSESLEILEVVLQLMDGMTLRDDEKTIVKYLKKQIGKTKVASLKSRQKAG